MHHWITGQRGCWAPCRYNPATLACHCQPGRAWVLTKSSRPSARAAWARSIGRAILWSGSEHAHVTDWTPDGQRLVLEVAHAQRRGNIQLLNLSGSRDLQPLATTNFDETSGRVSPDGRWLAYQSNESGRYEIYVQRFPAGGGKIQASAAGGVQPVWSRDGRELYFRTPADVMRVSVSAGDTATLGAPIAMFKDVYERIQADNHTTYDVLPDGRFVFIQRLAASESTVENPYVMAVFNWADELRQKLGR
jgi:hypothetical protein